MFVNRVGGKGKCHLSSSHLWQEFPSSFLASVSPFITHTHVPLKQDTPGKIVWTGGGWSRTHPILFSYSVNNRLSCWLICCRLREGGLPSCSVIPAHLLLAIGESGAANICVPVCVWVPVFSLGVYISEWNSRVTRWFCLTFEELPSYFSYDLAPLSSPMRKIPLLPHPCQHLSPPHCLDYSHPRECQVIVYYGFHLPFPNNWWC